MGPNETAAILFTSGSTGPAKGVVYTHGVFDAQVRYLQSQYGYGPNEIDLATFPLFALFDAATVGAGPIAKNIGEERTNAIRDQLGLGVGDACFFVRP